MVIIRIIQLSPPPFVLQFSLSAALTVASNQMITSQVLDIVCHRIAGSDRIAACPTNKAGEWRRQRGWILVDRSAFMAGFMMVSEPVALRLCANRMSLGGERAFILLIFHAYQKQTAEISARRNPIELSPAILANIKICAIPARTKGKVYEKAQK